METNGGAKLCRYCEQTYTQYNEPIYIVCVCENIPRYAHGSCFRNWLGKYEYGVCKMCLSKTKLIPDGWKSISEWKLPQNGSNAIGILHFLFTLVFFFGAVAYIIWFGIKECFSIYCFVILGLLLAFLIILIIMGICIPPLKNFYKELRNENMYWKVVYCREAIGKRWKRTLWRYSDVPTSVLTEEHIEIETGKDQTDLGFDNEFADPEISKKPTTFTEPSGFENLVLDFNKTWEPKSYPRIKRNPVYGGETFYANQAKQYTLKKETLVKQKNYYENGNLQSESEKYENEIFHTEEPERVLVDDYIEKRAENFYNSETAGRLSPSYEYMMDLRPSTKNLSNSSPYHEELSRAKSAPSLLDLFSVSKTKDSMKRIFGKRPQSEGCLTSINGNDFKTHFSSFHGNKTPNAMPTDDDIEYKKNNTQTDSLVKDIREGNNRPKTLLALAQENQDEDDFQVLPNYPAMSNAINSLPHESRSLNTNTNNESTEDATKMQNVTEEFKKHPRKVLQDHEAQFRNSLHEGPPEETKNYELDLNMVHRTSEAEEMPDTNQGRQIKIVQPFVPVTGSKEEIDEILNTPLEKLNLGEVLGDDVQIGKKRKSLFDANSLFFQPH